MKFLIEQKQKMANTFLPFYRLLIFWGSFIFAEIISDPASPNPIARSEPTLIIDWRSISVSSFYYSKKILSFYPLILLIIV